MRQYFYYKMCQQYWKYISYYEMATKLLLNETVTYKMCRYKRYRKSGKKCFPSSSLTRNAKFGLLSFSVKIFHQNKVESKVTLYANLKLNN